MILTSNGHFMKPLVKYRLENKSDDVIDILEVGTPVITKEGLVPVYHVKLRYPNLCVFADTNIIDGEAMECEDACKAHADIVM